MQLITFTRRLYEAFFFRQTGVGGGTPTKGKTTLLLPNKLLQNKLQ